MALAWAGQKPKVWTGRLNGRIVLEPHGENGFGYDPLFVPIGYGKTLAEISLSQKNQISHRARALAQVAAYLRKELEKERRKG
jgi:XTP/dITP diphosphohydrolase